jgi:4-hydroxybenzoate polyprenyltransferase
MLEYIKLMRLNQPTGFFLLFWPCAFGLMLASSRNVSIYLLLLFFIGSIAMRGAGCIINDIVDRDIDKKVKRTKNRPIASGKIPILKGSIFAAFLSCVGLIVLLNLPIYAIYVSLFSVILIFIYPFMKRLTNCPQAFLAITFNIGSIIAYLSLSYKVDASLALLYLSCVFWTLGYDTIYGHQDKEYDKKIGVKSTSIFFEQHTYSALALFYIGMILCLIAIGALKHFDYLYFVVILCAAAHLLWQIYTLDKDSPEICLRLFKSNTHLGAIVFFAFLSQI